MAEEFIEKIYRYADAITSAEILMETYRVGVTSSDFDAKMNHIMGVFSQIAKDMLEEFNMKGKDLWESLKRFSDYYSAVALLDEIELNCLPIVREYIDSFPKIDVDDGCIRFRSSKYGFMYLSDIDDSIEQFDSKINPMKEAYYIAKNIYHPSKHKFVFLGAGLGYIPYQLYKLSEGEIEIHVFYNDRESYEYARAYGVLDWIPKENINVTVSGNMTDFLVCATDNCDEYYFYMPDLKKYTEEENNKVNIYVKSKRTEYLLKELKSENLYRNIKRVNKTIRDFDYSHIKKKIILVAGGPSVDDNIEFLNKAHENGMSIICVGTVFKKLINEGVNIDVVTACDPFISVAAQFIDVEKDSVPLIMGLNTNYRVAKLYSGDKYLVAIDGTRSETMEYVEKNKMHIFPSAATVTSLAFNLAVYFGAKEIYLVGADFGFPGNMSHASGTEYRKEVADNNTIIVDGVNGKVKSDYQMVAYKEQLEEYISDNPNIKVYNMSKCGANIKGTIIFQDNTTDN